MKALKGLLIYIGIVLAMILGIGIILFAIMYFSPSFRIMGIGVARNNGVLTGNPVVLTEYSGYSDIEINVSSKKIGVSIVNSDDAKDISYSLDLSVFGLSFDPTEYKIVKDVRVENSTLKVNLVVTEPNGYISANDSTIKIIVPSNNFYSFIINTESGDVSIDGNEKTPLQLERLTVSTTSGDFAISNIDNFVETKCHASLFSLNLITKSGNFDFTKLASVSVNGETKLSGTSGAFTFKNLNSSVNATGSGLKIKADEIVTGAKGFKFISENGFFEIGKISTPNGAENTIVTENCDVKIGEISGRTGIVTTYGNITIGTLRNITMLNSEHGNISITKAYDDINVSTDMGNIIISSYERNAVITSRKGNIDVKCTGEYQKGVYSRIENTDGAVKVENKINRLLVTTHGSSKVEVTFFEIKGNLEINDVFQHKVSVNNQGSATIYMSSINSVPFKFMAKGNIDGEISGLTPEYAGNKVQSSDNYQYFPTASESSKAECAKSCYFDFLGRITFKSIINR